MSRLSGYPYVEKTWDASAIADGNEEALEVTVPGASLGDFVMSSFSLDVADANSSSNRCKHSDSSFS